MVELPLEDLSTREVGRRLLERYTALLARIEELESQLIGVTADMHRWHKAYMDLKYPNGTPPIMLNSLSRPDNPGEVGHCDCGAAYYRVEQIGQPCEVQYCRGTVKSSLSSDRGQHG